MKNNQEVQEVSQEEFRSQYREVLGWLRDNPHIKKRKAEGGPEYYDYVCRCGAALIAMVNSGALDQIPADVDWQLSWGVQRDRPSIRRVAMTMSVEDLKQLADLKELRSGGNLGKLDKYITVIWQSETEGKDKNEEYCRETSFVTAYFVPFVDKISDSQQRDFAWSPYGRSQERAALIDQLLSRWREE